MSLEDFENRLLQEHMEQFSKLSKEEQRLELRRKIKRLAGEAREMSINLARLRSKP